MCVCARVCACAYEVSLSELISEHLPSSIGMSGHAFRISLIETHKQKGVNETDL